MFSKKDLFIIKSLTDHININPETRVNIQNYRGDFPVTTGNHKVDELLFSAVDCALFMRESSHSISTLDPFVNDFIRLVWNVNPKVLKACINGRDESAHQAMLIINWIFERYRENRHGMKKKNDNRKRAESRNRDSLYSYVDTLFDNHAKITVVRVDLHYRKESSDCMLFEQVVADRKRYLRQVIQQYPSLLGYAWRLEYGKKRAFHYHMVFFFNGDRQWQDVLLGKELGEHWNRSTNDTPTYYYNCNANKERYEHTGCGIGMIRHYEHEKRSALRKALNYLCKEDPHIAVLQTTQYRTFGKGEIPPRSSRAGRPRSRRISFD